MLVIEIVSKRKKVWREKKRLENFMQRGIFFCWEWSSIIDRKSQRSSGGGPGVDVVFDGAFRGVGDEEVIVGEGVVVISSSLDMLTNSCLGGIMVSLIFLEGLDEEALVEFIVEWCEKDEDDDRNEEDDLFN
ncbi:hypothetical protein Tco_0596014 [Tanacetum coccineum]